MPLPPKVLFQGKLKLTGEQEEILMHHAIERRNSIRTQMGWLNNTAISGLGVQGTNTLWRGAACTGWALKRQEAYAQYENDFTFRTFPGNRRRFSTLFQHFNNSVNVPRRAARTYMARACEALVNTSPFTGFMPEGNDDDASAIKLAERLFNNELEESRARFELRHGITQACLSEAVMKITLAPTGGEPESVDGCQLWMRGGQPMRDGRGGYVFGDEPLDNHPSILGMKVLKREPSVEFAGGETLSKPRSMIRNSRTVNRLEVRPTGWENFFCNILEPDIHSSDCIFHEFDNDLDNLLRRAQGVRMTKSARLWLTDLKNSSQMFPQAEGSQPHIHRGEIDVEMFGPIKVLICEMWMRFDVLDRGQADEICFMFAVPGGGNQIWPIYYDLTKDASPTKRRPFEVIRVIPVRDRWYGMGFYDLLSNDHEFIDDAWNRIRARSSASGRLDIIRRDAFEGMEYGTPASLSNGKVWVVKEDVPITVPLANLAGSKEFPEIDDRIWEMLKMALQNAKIASGTMLPGDASQAGLEAGKTATAQHLLANESELMSNDTTQDVMDGIIATLKQALLAVFNEFDPESANLLLGPDAGTELAQWLATNKPEDFSKHVKLLLTKARSKQALEAAMAANQLLTGGMAWLQLCQMNPELAEVLKPWFVDALNAHDCSNADQVLEKSLQAITKQMVQAAAMGQPPTGSAPAQPTPAA